MQHDASNIDLAPCYYFCTSENGIILQVNERLCNKLGYTTEELPGKKAELIFTLSTRLFQETHLFPLLKMQGFAEEIFITLKTKNNEPIPVLVNTERKVIDGEILTLYAGILVQNRKKFEDEIIAAKKTAETALNENLALIQAKRELQQRMEQLDEQISLINKQGQDLRQFNHVVTHSVQEPLRKLSVFADMLTQTGDRQQQQKVINNLVRVLEQLRAIINGLQQYVWLTGDLTEQTRVDLNEVLFAAAQQLQTEQPGIHLHIDKTELPAVKADAKQLHLLFYHVLLNTIRFRKPGKDAYVSVSSNSLRLNKFSALQDKYEYVPFLKIDIADSGVGFNAEYKDQVFELFRRLHNNSGSGIGLALCRKVIENHHGNISIDSKENEGTTVSLLLPLEQEDNRDS